MDHQLIKTSQRLSELDVRINLDGYAIHVYWFRVMFKEHDWFIRRHAHSTFEFHFIARGDCEVVLDDRSFHIGPRHFFLSAPEVHHCQQPGHAQELVEYSLNCDIRQTGVPEESHGDEIGRLRSLLLSTPCAPFEDHYGAIPLIETALLEADRRLPGFETMIRTLVVMILVACSRAMGVPGLPAGSEPVVEDKDDVRMSRILQFITDNIAMDLSPGDVAGFMNMSERQLGRIVRRYKGFSTKKFITRTKLRKAKMLLCTTDLAMKEIAEMLGFANEYYFNSVFKKHEGFPPGVFRESMRAGSPGDAGEPRHAGPATRS